MSVSEKEVKHIIHMLTNIEMSLMIRDAINSDHTLCTNMSWIKHLLKGDIVYSLEYTQNIITKKCEYKSVLEIIPAYLKSELLNILPENITKIDELYELRRSYHVTDKCFHCGYYKQSNKKSLVYAYDDLEINALAYLLVALKSNGLIS